jgi:CRISPR-associated protein Cmr5
MNTRAQQHMVLALEQINALEQKFPDPKHKTKSIYRSLAKGLPAMIMKSGLCQTLAFHTDKKTSKDKARAEAHEYLLHHIGKILGVKDPLEAVQKSGDVIAYMHQTKQVLEAIIYFQRFAVSMLKVEKEEQP